MACSCTSPAIVSFVYHRVSEVVYDKTAVLILVVLEQAIVRMMNQGYHHGIAWAQK